MDKFFFIIRQVCTGFPVRRRGCSSARRQYCSPRWYSRSRGRRWRRRSEPNRNKSCSGRARRCRTWEAACRWPRRFSDKSIPYPTNPRTISLPKKLINRRNKKHELTDTEIKKKHAGAVRRNDNTKRESQLPEKFLTLADSSIVDEAGRSPFDNNIRARTKTNKSQRKKLNRLLCKRERIKKMK